MSNRNYTPFLDMNLLVSDDLLQTIHDTRFAFAVLLVLTMFVGYITFSLVQSLVLYLLRSRYKKRPYVDSL